MKNTFLSLLVVMAVIIVVSGCKEDDPVVGFDYHIHINSPDLLDKHRGDTLQIDIDFEDHNDGLVHNIYYKLFNVDDTSIIAKEFTEHVHEEVEYNFTDFVWTDDVDSNSIFNCHCNWILRAEVWDDAGGNKVSESIQFHVHPM